MYCHIVTIIYFVEMNVCIYDNNYISITKYIKRLYNVYNSNCFSLLWIRHKYFI